jgi:hypothetical protein
MGLLARAGAAIARSFGRRPVLDSKMLEHLQYQLEQQHALVAYGDSTVPAVRPGPFGPTTEPDPRGALPGLRREPPIQIAPTFSTVSDCQSAITFLDYGQFQLASWLIEQQRWNSRFRGVQNTWADGLIGTPIRWEPGRDNALGRRAAQAIKEDWPLMASATTRKQISRWGLDLGVAFAQKHWYESPSSGRMIPRLEHYHPQWAIWDWSQRAYKIWTLDGWAIVPSPSLMVPGQPWEPLYPITSSGQPDTLRRWVVHEPYGQHSWRDGLVHASWNPWLRLEWANRDMARCSEKIGLGIIKVKYPRMTDLTALNLLISKLRQLGQEGVIPVEQYKPTDGTTAEQNYDAEPFEWSGTGFNSISGTREGASSDLAVLYLGHNTQAETKGASVGASAQVGNLIRGDIRVGATWAEWTTMQPQVVEDWAEVNFGDRGLAPVAVYETDPPAENQAAATTLLNVSQAVALLKQHFTGINWTEVLNRFRVPTQDGGVSTIAAVAPAAGKPPTGAPGQPGSDPQTQPEPKKEPAQTGQGAK